MNKQCKKVFLALSGGVDSAVSALLLKKKGFEVIGIFMKNWSSCNWLTEKRIAERIAYILDIQFEVWDFEFEYKREVMDYFFAEYAAGKTPNPDIECNRKIKFGLFFNKAFSMGADNIATGHYTRIINKNGRTFLYKGSDQNKDQSYFLYTLTEEKLSKIIFPIGNLIKKDVRTLAKKNNLPNHDKKDSQGICFVGKIHLPEFLSEKLSINSGLIINKHGVKIGVHNGVQYYTEGQRVGLKLSGFLEPLYVAYKAIEQNIIIATEKNSPLVNNSVVYLQSLHTINEGIPMNNNVYAKIRYRQHEQEVTITLNKNKVKVKFTKPQFGLSCGQSIVFYQRDCVLGGGVIIKVEKPNKEIKYALNQYNLMKV